MDLLSSVRCNLIYLGEEEGVILYLGSDTNIDADWDTGVFRDNFDGTWPMLDGHPVYIEITEEGDDYNLYSIPIKLNGEECNLQVADKQSRKCPPKHRHPSPRQRVCHTATGNA